MTLSACRASPVSPFLLTTAALALALAAAFGLLAPVARAESPAAEILAALCTENEAGAVAEDAEAFQVYVTVEKVRSSKGLITAVLYSDDPKTFLKSGARLDRIRVAATEGETLLCLRAPASGRYSVALYHDENGNKEFDRDFLGVPTEGYGFSKNPGFRFGKPDVEETLFTIGGATTDLRISLLYLQG